MREGKFLLNSLFSTPINGNTTREHFIVPSQIREMAYTEETILQIIFIDKRNEIKFHE